jgi:predicted nucleotidyltransferase
MENKNKIISSFYLQDTLNPMLWDNSSDFKNSSLKKEIRKGLIKISDEFLDFLSVDTFVQDVTMTGSLANFNWSNFSDIDLHIIYNFDDFGDNSKLYSELFDLKRTVFNSTHNIKIKGYEVEVYVQDLNEMHLSSGVYSIMYDKWVKKPSPENVKIDSKKIKDKAFHWMDLIDTTIHSLHNDDNLENSIKKLDKLKNKLKKFRSSGLERGGEFSYENLVFKYLRRNGYIQKLFDSKINFIDKSLSIEENFIKDK